MKCDQCGLESGFEEAFVKQPRLLGLTSRKYCPICVTKENQRSAVYLFVLLPITAGVLYLAHPALSWSGRLLGLASVMLAFIPLTVLHEMAHVIVANALGLRPFSVTLGFGRRLLSGEALGLRWEIRLFPLGGVTRISGPPRSTFRLRLWLTYLAGPALHGVLAYLAWRSWVALTSTGSGDSLMAYVVTVLFYSNVILLVINLLPIKSLTVFGVSGSDGWHLLKLPFLPPEQARRMADLQFVPAAVDAARRKEFGQAEELLEQAERRLPGDWHVAVGRGLVRVRRGDLGGARQAFDEGLKTLDTAEAGYRYLLMNNVAYADVLLEDPDLLEEAEDYSKEALENAPWIPEFVGTRGAVLAFRGRYEEGISLLKKAMQEVDGPDSRAEEACLLALAEARRGNAMQSEAYLSLARRLDPGNYLLGIVADRTANPAGGLSIPAKDSNLESAEPPQAAGSAAEGGRATWTPVSDVYEKRRAIWWTSADFWSRFSLAWGFWSLIALKDLTITPGISFLILGTMISFYQHSAMLIALAVAWAWTGVVSLLDGSGEGLALGGLHLLAGAACYVAYRKRRRMGEEGAAETNASNGGQEGFFSRHLVVPLAAALLVSCSVALLIGLVGLVIYVAILPGVSDPAAAFDRFYTENSQLFIYVYLIEPFALAGLAAAIASLHARGRLPVICYASIAAGGLVLLVMSGLQVL